MVYSREKKVDKDAMQISDFGGQFRQLHYSTDNCILVPIKSRSEDQQGVLLGVAQRKAFNSTSKQPIQVWTGQVMTPCKFDFNLFTIVQEKFMFRQWMLKGPCLKSLDLYLSPPCHLYSFPLSQNSEINLHWEHFKY